MNMKLPSIIKTHASPLILATTGSVLIGSSSPLLAEDLSVTGFATWSVSKSDNATPWYVNREISDETCYSCDSIWGIQVDYQPLESLRVSGQIVKRPEDAWDEPVVEWAYAAYAPVDGLELRAGKLRLPMFLMSEYYYVGNAYPWVRPVPELYNRQLGITAFEGIDFIYDWNITDSVTLSIHPYYGTDREDKVDRIDQMFTFTFEEQYGLALDLTTENLRFRINYFEADVDHTINYDPAVNLWSPAGPPGTYTIAQNVTEFSPSSGYIIYNNGASRVDFSVPSETYKNTSLGLTYEIPFGFEIWGEYQNDEYSITQYGALTWSGWGFTPYYIFSESYSVSQRKTTDYDEDEKYKTSQTQTLGVRYDLPFNFSINLEYALSENKQVDPEYFDSSAPKAQFVTSYWQGTPDASSLNPPTGGGPPTTTTPNTIWERLEDNKAEIWTFAINWNF